MGLGFFHVFRTPSRLKLAALSLWLAIPFLGLQIFLLMESPWWRPPLEVLKTALIVSAPFLFFFSLGILRGKIWIFRFWRALAWIWVACSAVFAVYSKSTDLALLVVGIGIYVTVLSMWLRRLLSRTYFHPYLPWYQGWPSPVSGLRAQLPEIYETTDFEVGRIDSDGALIYLNPVTTPTPAKLGKYRARFKKKVDLRLAFGDKKIQIPAQLMTFFQFETGAGFQFASMQPDLKKDLEDFLELLRSRGVVDG